MKFDPLHSSLGAAVTDVDCADIRPDLAVQLREALTRWQVLLFRDQDVSDGGFVRFCRNFGDLEILPEPEKRNPNHPEIFNLSNVKPDGSLTQRDHPQAVFLRGIARWHTDSSFRKTPCLATILFAKTVPPEGGDTEFANMIEAYESLAEDERRELECLNVVHSYAYSRAANPGKLAPMSSEELALVPDVVHPMVRLNTDRTRSVYLGGHASHIAGAPVEESRAKIRSLEDRLTSIGNVYRHKWCAGDILIWDNRTTLHRLTDYAIDRYPRIMCRCTVAGDEPVVPVSAGNGA